MSAIDLVRLGRDVDRLARIDGTLTRKARGADAVAATLTGPVIERTTTLHAWLDDALDWLQAHPGHPRLPEREERWFARLTEYEALCNVLIRAERAGLIQLAAVTQMPLGPS